MSKVTHFKRKKVILIVITILILCGIIALVAIMNMYFDKTPNKAIYVWNNKVLLVNFS